MCHARKYAVTEFELQVDASVGHACEIGGTEGEFEGNGIVYHACDFVGVVEESMYTVQ